MIPSSLGQPKRQDDRRNLYVLGVPYDLSKYAFRFLLLFRPTRTVEQILHSFSLAMAVYLIA